MQDTISAGQSTCFWRRLRLLSLTLIIALGGLAGLFAFVHPPAAAQQVVSTSTEPISFPHRRPFGTSNDATVALAAGDMDGDGDLDIVSGNRGEPGSISLNDGYGNYPLSQLISFGAPGTTTDLAAGDLDGDGDLDVVVSTDDGACIAYPNDGSGNLGQKETVVSPLGSANDSRVALGDLNGDGYFDIVLTRSQGPTLLLFNDGAAHFPLSSTLGAKETRFASVALGDLDDDGKLDVVAAPERGPGAIFYQSAGAFAITQAWGTTDQEVRDITLGDFSGDGKLDFVTTQAGTGDGFKPHKLYRNLGVRSFKSTPAFGQGEGQLWSVAAGDLNGDGSLDLVTGIGVTGWLSRIALNTGSGEFPDTQITGFGPPDQTTRAVALADVNADGFLDIITGNQGFQNAIYLNGQDMRFSAIDLDTTLETDTGGRSGHREITSVAVGDVNGDNRLDIVTGNTLVNPGNGEPFEDNLIFINEGDGGFRAQPFGFLTENTWSVALADLNGDGALDVIAGGMTGAHTIYLNDQAGNFPSALRSVISIPHPAAGQSRTGLATGDLDHANGIDLVACGLTFGCTVYFNDGAGRFSAERASALGAPSDPTAAAALADLNGDGWLDIVAINRNTWNYVYLNDGQGQFPARLRQPFGTGSGFTWAVAVADVNADGRPDILTGNFFESGAIYLNDGEGRFPAALARPFGSSTDRTYSLVTGDINGDGFVDFVAGNWGTDAAPGQNVVYLNDGRGNFAASPVGTPYWTRCVALGDMDGNGTLDVVEGNRYGGQRLRVHYNRLRNSDNPGNREPVIAVTRPVTTRNAALFSSPQLLAAGSIPVAFTLKDAESGVVGRVALDYSLDGGGRWTPIQITDTRLTRDLTTSPSGVSHQISWDTQSSGVFGRSDNAVLQLRAYPQPDRPAAPGTYRYTDTAPSLNQWPYVAATTFPFSIAGTSIAVFSGTIPYSEALVYLLPRLKEGSALPLGGVEHPYRTEASGFLQGRAEVPVGDRLVAVWPSAEVTETTPKRLYASGDTFPMTIASKSVIQSRLVVSDARRIAAINVWADISASAPLSLNLVTPRGDQIPLSAGALRSGEALCNTTPAEDGCGAVARRIFTPTLPAPSQPLAEGAWTLVASTTATEPVQLLGWGLALKLSPLHFTSAAPVTGGLDSYAVTASGVHTLTVSSKNPLLLFDLDVALEWNASRDEHYQALLSADLRRASELLYDWSNGQVALGNVRIYHDARRNTLPGGASAWNNAHIRIYASNRLRPNADQGGVISEAFTETIQIDNQSRSIGYLPGQVRIGATWNRYGDVVTGNLGDDWPAALAHELGHFLLFLDDNYLTLEDNLIVPLSDDDCPGAMNNPYSNAYSEFHPELNWKTTGCKKTLSEQNTARSDWETIGHFYPGLNAPTVTFTETEKGPSLLPLAVTRVTWQAPDPGSDTLTWMAQALGKANANTKTILNLLCKPGASALGSRATSFSRNNPTAQINCPAETITSTLPLEVPVFYLKAAAVGETYRASSQARAFLFQGAPYPTVMDLGQPDSDQIFARGARPLDRLCIYDQPQGLVGCKDIVAGDDQVVMRPAPGWEPQLIIAPVTTRTLQISLTLPLTDINTRLPLMARLYPMNGPASQPFAMTSIVADTRIIYGVPITTETPVLEGYVWVGSSNADALDPYQTVTEFAIGGNPAPAWGRSTPADPSDVRIRARRVRIRARRAPATSADGQVTVYPDEKKLGQDREWSFTLQPATRLPAELPWATPVGRAYWLAASDNITDFGESSITFEYLGSDVPSGEEAFIRMYFWNEVEKRWHLLEDQNNHPEHNLISAHLQGPGLYALFSHYEIPLQPGWNLIGYPVQGTRPITDALSSITGEYSMVFGFDDSTPADPWSVYMPGEGSWANDLREFRFGRGYWIYMSDKAVNRDGVVLRLKGNPQTTQPVTTTLAADILRNPPAVYFGKVQSDRADFVPTPGLAVKAYIGKRLCGEGRLDDKLRYVVKVQAASVSEIDCGTPGAPVSFRITGLPDVTLAAPGWDNGVPHPQDLRIPAGSGTAAPASPAVCQEMVRDGTFEAAGAWKRPVTDNRGRIVQRDAEHGHSLLLGVLPGEAPPRRPAYSTAFQNDILLPASASSIILSFSVQTDAREESGGRVVQLYRRDWTFPPIATAAIARSGEWRTMAVDLSRLKGQYVSLYFEVANAGFMPTRWMAVDNVSIQACR